MGAIAGLEQRRAFVMIAMGMGDDDIFDIGGVQSQLAEALDDLRLHGVIVQRINQDDATAGLQRPGGMDLGADPIEIVEHLGRLGIPGGAVRDGARDAAARQRIRHHANPRQGAGKIGAFGLPGGGQMRIHRRLGGGIQAAGGKEDRCQSGFHDQLWEAL
jgi:hypothetical protein